MNSFLQLSAERRRLAFQQVDEVMGLQAFSVEKDFWVCWTLRELFTMPRIGEHLTFKGGTSLSKAWKLIRRFSEDIDLVVDKDAFFQAPTPLGRLVPVAAWVLAMIRDTTKLAASTLSPSPIFPKAP
jgi:hypothetical protein